jgi:hypothetical protein
MREYCQPLAVSCHLCLVADFHRQIPNTAFHQMSLLLECSKSYKSLLAGERFSESSI